LFSTPSLMHGEDAEVYAELYARVEFPDPKTFGTKGGRDEICDLLDRLEPSPKGSRRHLIGFVGVNPAAIAMRSRCHADAPSNWVTG
jgi:hypothetical protein